MIGARQSRLEARKKNFKKSVDVEESRKKREDHTVEIRKSKREENLMKKRREKGQQTVVGSGEAATQALDAAVLARIPKLVQDIWSADTATQLECTKEFRQLLSIEKNPPISEVISTSVVPRFVEFLNREDSPQLQFEAAWVLTNIASGTCEHTTTVVEAGAVPIFVKLMTSPHEDVREQAIWALGNIAGDSPEYRNLVLQQGAMAPLLEQLSHTSKFSMLRNATWTLSNLCRGKPQPPFDLVRPALKTLAHLVYSNDEEVLTDACWALSYLSDGSNDKIQAVIESGVTRRLVELLMHQSVSVQTPALRTIGNIVTGDDTQTQIVINCSALPCLATLLNSPKKSIRKEACWTISNITAGTKEQIQAVIDANIIPPLINLLKNAEFDVKKEAAWAISNATSGGTIEQMQYLVSQGCIPPLCNLLTVQDFRIIIVALEGLENILRVGERLAVGGLNQYALFVEEAEGVDKIESLQTHINEEIYSKALKILETYFNGASEPVEGVTPVSTEGQFGFGLNSHVPSQGGFNFGDMQE
ncbi:Importin subunit alpha-1b [Galdieria sulphuraria]|uniref:Importin subunit alpha n=1 Tax=Galdieria sulphuraria TaxID=130081 RepID=M2Y5Z2_GALSU|nr:importin alpha [Galdieria sulphuraria]EME31274.1 importin alpha [Galdieria sulphuraria]GJD07701.1 Importin subunit alpha-1b [Galdieria sulphuraria]|eukprot:XP_005707794.1 importin alpha [Galdieria sulphuraria]